MNAESYSRHSHTQEALKYAYGEPTSTLPWAYETIPDTTDTPDEGTDRVIWQASQVPDAGLQQLMREASEIRQRMYHVLLCIRLSLT